MVLGPPVVTLLFWCRGRHPWVSADGRPSPLYLVCVCPTGETIVDGNFYSGENVTDFLFLLLRLFLPFHLLKMSCQKLSTREQ